MVLRHCLSNFINDSSKNEVSKHFKIYPTPSKQLDDSPTKTIEIKIFYVLCFLITMFYSLQQNISIKLPIIRMLKPFPLHLVKADAGV